MRIVFLLTLVSISSFIQAEECACDTYPFNPNPPCYPECVRFLAENKDYDLRRIENLDPGVALSIFALRTGERGFVANLDSIINKRTLEKEAIKAIPPRGEWKM